jgi:hypothetical protein
MTKPTTASPARAPHKPHPASESGPKTPGRVQPPPEDELGGGDICSLEWKPPTDDDKPLDWQESILSTKTPNPRKFVPVAIAVAVAVVSLLALLIVDHGPWNRPVVKDAAAIPQSDTAATARAAGATVSPTDPKPPIEPAPLGPKPVNPVAPN